jgi:hypothetical protein
MKIVIESTDVITRIGNVAVRVWDGVTENGVRCQVFVHQLAAHAADDVSEFERALAEMPPPREALLGHVLAGMPPSK